eukprot:TRINITY_DN14014_c0_g1_i1.p1 TRINITY_DN14014_c0_g1~~TRINITY_DN14014_c0_g1_i1.p1  ORF type:complete len:552 (+),score=71.29 TRINITY_DN14014_c0_g1_i1:45-1658(+)
MDDYHQSLTSLDGITEGGCRWSICSETGNLVSNFNSCDINEDNALLRCKQVAVAADLFVQRNFTELSTCNYIVEGSVPFGETISRGLTSVFAEQDDLTYIKTMLLMQVACASIEQTVTAVLGYKDGKGPILREMLQTKKIVKSVPKVVMEHLRQLLFPEGMNLRNLVSHGFLDRPRREYVSLLIMLALELPSWCSLHKKDVPSFDFLYCQEYREDYTRILSGLPDDLYSDTASDADGNLTPKVHESEEEYLLRAIPYLEHRLRLLFCSENSSNLTTDHSKAQQGQYFATLDGYGQRSKHILLLQKHYQETDTSPVVFNNLVTKLGPGLHSMLLDLFMQDAGPGIRSLVAHGRCNLLTVFKDGPGAGRSGIFSTAVAVILLLLQDIEAKKSPLWHWVDTYSTPGHYHPAVVLQRSFQKAVSELVSFTDFLKLRFLSLDDDILSVSGSNIGEGEGGDLQYLIKDLDVKRLQPSPGSRKVIEEWGSWTFKSTHSVSETQPETQMDVVADLLQGFSVPAGLSRESSTEQMVNLSRSHTEWG